MERVSTSSTYQSALMNILAAQNRQQKAETQVSTGKIADDLKGFGVHADSLTATRSLKARIDGHVENAKILASTLEVQDQALGQLGAAAQGARKAIADALASGSAVGLMTALHGHLGQSVDALNTEYQGRHLFAGGQSDTEPLPPLTMAALTAAVPNTSVLFRNDQLVTTSRLDDKLTVETGFLASNLGGLLLEAFEDVQIIHQGTPLSGTLTQAQQDDLEDAMRKLDLAWSGINEAVAHNGGLQNRLEAVRDGLADRQTALTAVLGNMTDVDMADAVSRLQLAQTALQASAQVFSTLTGSSLLNVLSR